MWLLYLWLLWHLVSRLVLVFGPFDDFLDFYGGDEVLIIILPFLLELGVSFTYSLELYRYITNVA